jgi:alpha-glucosidase (family GH31 glycosyl hydrolase)
MSMRRLLLCGMLLALGALVPFAHTSGAAGQDAADPVTWTVAPAPFRLTFDHGDAVAAEQAPADTTGPGGRMSYRVGGTCCSATGSSLHHLTDLVSQAPVDGGTAYTVATDEPGRTATVTVTQTPRGAHVSWTFAATTATGSVTTLFEALAAGPDDHYLGGSSAAYVDLRGHVRSWRPGKEGRHADNYCSNQEEVATPFYLSSSGYGFYAETTDVGRFAFPGAVDGGDGPECATTPTVPPGASRPINCPLSATAQSDRVQICVKASELAYDVFAGSPEQVTTDYHRTVGMPALPPPTEFGLIKWRDVSQNQAQVLGDVAQFKTLGIPLSTIFVDNPWELQPASNTTRQNGSACTNSGAFDPRYFPDPKAMIDTIHAEGVRFGLWVTPHAATTATGGGSCTGLNSVYQSSGWIVPGTNYIDFTNPAARQHFIAQLENVFKLGVDMAKEDRSEEYQLETATLSGGSGNALYDQYPALYQSAVSEALRSVDGDDFLTLVRTAGAGTAQVVHGMWGSDANEAFSGLRSQIRFGTSESLTGHFAWGSDVGGIDPVAPATAANSPTPSLFTRWAQFGALSPVMEVGGAGMNATPWLYPQATVDRFRAAAVLHHELYPYFYALARQAAQTGVPILRTVGYEYPSDQQAWALDQEFMIGPSLLAAPVSAERAETDGAAGQPTPVSVYLPAGRWIDLYTGEVLDGGQTITRMTSLDELPFYMKAGTAIGFNLRTPNVWSQDWGVDDLSEPGRAGFMVAPAAGRTTAASSDGGTLVADGTPPTLALDLSGAPAQTQVLVLTQHAPFQIRAGGVLLPRLDSAAALHDAAAGWTMTAAPFGGALLKLPTPAGAAHVDVDYFPNAQGTVGGTVPATLSLTLGAPASFGAFTPGVARQYTASTTASVTSTAGDATLSVSPGRLTNGSFSLAAPVVVTPEKSSWSGPVSDDAFAIGFQQSIGATEPLRTGSYSTTVTFTLSTTSP